MIVSNNQYETRVSSSQSGLVYYRGQKSSEIYCFVAKHFVDCVKSTEYQEFMKDEESRGTRSRGSRNYCTGGIGVCGCNNVWADVPRD